MAANRRVFAEGKTYDCRTCAVMVERDGYGPADLAQHHSTKKQSSKQKPETRMCRRRLGDRR